MSVAEEDGSQHHRAVGSVTFSVFTKWKARERGVSFFVQREL